MNLAKATLQCLAIFIGLFKATYSTMKCESWNENSTDVESVNKDYRDHNEHYRKASKIVANLRRKLIVRDWNHVTFNCSCAVQLTNEMIPVRFRPGKQDPNLKSYLRLKSNNVTLYAFHKYLKNTFQLGTGKFPEEDKINGEIQNLQKELSTIMEKTICTSMNFGRKVLERKNTSKIDKKIETKENRKTARLQKKWEDALETTLPGCHHRLSRFGRFIVNIFYILEDFKIDTELRVLE